MTNEPQEPETPQNSSDSNMDDIFDSRQAGSAVNVQGRQDESQPQQEARPVWGQLSGQSEVSHSAPKKPSEGAEAADLLQQTINQAQSANAGQSIAGDGEAQSANAGQSIPGDGEAQSANAGQSIPGEAEAQAERRHPLEDWMNPDKSIPATKILIGVNAVVFAATVLMSFGAALMAQPSSFYVAWGADFAPVTLTGQWWRTFTAMFMHIGAFHLAMNMVCLWDGGGTMERLLGWRKMIAIYFLAGLGSSLLSLLGNPTIVCAGASGAIMGLYGALIVFLRVHKNVLPEGTFKHATKLCSAFVAYNILYGFIRPGIDNFGHIGGLIAGAAVCWALITPVTEKSLWRRRNSVTTCGIAALFAIFYGLLVWGYQFSDYAMLEKANGYLKDKQYTKVLDITHEVLKSSPSSGFAYLLQAFADMGLHNTEQLIDDATHLIALEPKRSLGYSMRSFALSSDGDYEKALTDAKQALSLDPTDRMSSTVAVLCCQSLDKSEEANVLLQSLLQKNPKDADLHLMHADNLISQGKYNDAVTEIKNLSGLREPEITRQNFALARAYNASGDLASARLLLEGFKGKNESALMELAWIEMRSGNLNSAKDLLKKGVATDPHSARSKQMIAIGDLVDEDYASVIRNCDDGIRVCKHGPQTLQYLAVLRTLAARARGDKTPSNELIKNAPMKLDGTIWPQPVLDYFDGKISQQALHQQATSRGKLTEATAYVAFAQRANGNLKAAETNFNWVKDNGQRNYTEYYAALGALQAMQQGKTPTVQNSEGSLPSSVSTSDPKQQISSDH
jgi:membrane associated rhomboid family serine protease/tetratricopeptide (TPR) repeat protein